MLADPPNFISVYRIATRIIYKYCWKNRLNLLKTTEQHDNYFILNSLPHDKDNESSMVFKKLKREASQAKLILSDREEILEIIKIFFDAGKTKNLAPLAAIQLNDMRFSSYSDVPPFDLKDYATTIALQELRFVSISDYEYEILNPRIDLFENSAVVTFQLRQTGMIVDNYSFRGQHISMLSRATFVLIKSTKWKIVHVHLSKISE